MHCFIITTNKKRSDVICLFDNFESVKIRLENVKKTFIKRKSSDFKKTQRTELI